MSESPTLQMDEGDVCDDGHTVLGVTNRTDVPTSTDEGKPDTNGGRCTHGLLACRPCGSLPPGVNRLYPAPRGVRASMHEMGRWLVVVPNRADRRRRV